MALRIYTIRELLDAGKVKLRSLLAGVGTEDGSDFGLVLDVASRLFQGAQVSAVYILQQALPSTADAANLERLAELRAVTLEKPATKARGLLLFDGDAGGILAGGTRPAGTIIDFPAANTPDGIARSYVTLEAVEFGSPPAAPWTGATVSPLGSTSWRVRLSGIARDFVRVRQPFGIGIVFDTAIRRWDPFSGVAELYWSPPGFVPFHATTPTLTVKSAAGYVVAAEAVLAGKDGNMGPDAFTETINSGTVRIMQMGGGWEDDSAIDPTDARVVRMLEDEIAAGASLGNLQQIRELALACPDVALDDAVVYRGVRGPSSIDVVAIGRSQRTTIATAPDARYEMHLGVNGRQIGDVQAQRIQDYLLGEGPYSERLVSFFDDVRVVQLDYDRNGQNEDYDEYTAAAWARSCTDLRIVVSPKPGFRADSGFGLAQVHASPTVPTNAQLHPDAPATEVDPRLRVGDRVWVTVGDNADTLSLRSYATIVTPITGFARDRAYATIDPLVGGTVIEWGTAGPVMQPMLTAIFDYFDELGPGSYREAPKDPGYVRKFSANGLDAAPELGKVIDRWPSEGRRWRSGFRSAELMQRLLAVEGVRSVTIPFADFDPLPLHKIWLRGAQVLYASS